MADEEVFSDASDDEPEVDDDATEEGLSYVGQAARDALARKHAILRKTCWQVTHGKVVGEITQTPPMEYWKDSQISDDLETSHSDSFPEKMAEIIAKATQWVDITSLGPPDGKFVDAWAKGLKAIAGSGNSVTVRMLFGNIIGMPTDCDAIVKAMTKHPDYALPADCGIKLWVGSWRKGVSWNHAKIIAVDGQYLLTGGHNVWDPHYLAKNPVRDLSMEAEGQVTQDGHVFANKMWKYIIKKDKQYWGNMGLPDSCPMIMYSRCNCAAWPNNDNGNDDQYPPMYEAASEPLSIPEAIDQGDIPMISCGRYGVLHHHEGAANPSDSALTAMLDSAQKSIKMSLQDFGPIAIPPPLGPRAIPGGVWPENYLRAIGTAIYERGVDVQIVLSNPNSIPANLSATEANYGNGWTCADVASEIIKSIQKHYPDADEERLRGLVGVNLKLAYMRSTCGSCDWEEATKTGNHAKFFIIDDICYYIGSQNLYVCNLAEWGLIIDNEEQTLKVEDEYWNLLWAASFEDVPEDARDVDVDEVMNGLEIDRTPPEMADLSPEELEAALLAQKVAGTSAGLTPNSLMVWIKGATGLKDADGAFGGSSDSYVRLRILDGDGNTIKGPRETRVIHEGGADPVWNEEIEFEGLTTPGLYSLKLTVLDYDSVLGMENEIADCLAADDKLGAATIDLGELDNSKDWQDRDLVIADGWFADSGLSISLNTRGGWASGGVAAVQPPQLSCAQR